MWGSITSTTLVAPQGLQRMEKAYPAPHHPRIYENEWAMYQFFLDLLNDQVNGVGLGLSWMLIDIRFDLGKNVRSREECVT